MLGDVVAAKAGAISLTKSLGQAFAADGIRVNGLAPGLVDTKLTRVTTQNPDRLAASLAAIPTAGLATSYERRSRRAPPAAIEEPNQTVPAMPSDPPPPMK